MTLSIYLSLGPTICEQLNSSASTAEACQLRQSPLHRQRLFDQGLRHQNSAAFHFSCNIVRFQRDSVTSSTKVSYNRLIIGVRSWGKVWRTEFASNPAAYRVIEDEWTTKSFQVALIGVHLPQSQYSLNKAAEYVRVIIPMASNDIKMPKKPLSLDIWVYMPP